MIDCLRLFCFKLFSQSTRKKTSMVFCFIVNGGSGTVLCAYCDVGVSVPSRAPRWWPARWARLRTAGPAGRCCGSGSGSISRRCCSPPRASPGSPEHSAAGLRPPQGAACSQTARVAPSAPGHSWRKGGEEGRGAVRKRHVVEGGGGCRHADASHLGTSSSVLGGREEACKRKYSQTTTSHVKNTYEC